MIISHVRDYVMFRTEYDDEYDLVQIFKGLHSDSIYFNTPTDNVLSGLMKKDEKDPFRPSKIISFMTDEAAPCHINGRWIGADHAHPFGIEITARNHGLDFSYLATDFVGEDGITYTLLHILDKNTLLVLSENLGTSDIDYNYNKAVKGNLTSKKDGKVVETEVQTIGQIKSIRRKYKGIDLCKKTRSDFFDEFKVYKGLTLNGEDYAELYDEYDIINLPSAVRGFKESRPLNGYTENVDITNFGDVMISMKLTYRITTDGTVFVMFDNEKKMPIKWDCYLGTMFQAKNNLYGGKTLRFIPGLGGVEDKDGKVHVLKDGLDLKADFGRKFTFITKDYQLDKEVPPDRVVDVYYDEEGKAKMAFACGYLPLFDGDPAVRNKNTEYLAIPYSKKAYPVFLNGDLTRTKGVAYKKHFIPNESGDIEYEITFEGKTYKYKV